MNIKNTQLTQFKLSQRKVIWN